MSRYPKYTTKEEVLKSFLKDIETKEYLVKKINRLHNNVLVIESVINGNNVNIGYSWTTPVSFSIDGYAFITNYIYSRTTQKHKSQTLSGLKYEQIIDIEYGVFRYLYNRITEGETPTIEGLKEQLDLNKTQIIKVSNKPYTNVFEYLGTHVIINRNYQSIVKIRSIIRIKSYESNFIRIGRNNIRIKYRNNKKFYTFKGKEYQSLVFLNHEDINGIKEII